MSKTYSPALATLAVVVVLGGLLVPLEAATRVWDVLRDFAHVPIGAALALGLAYWGRRLGGPPLRLAPAVAYLAASLGILGLTELVQPLTGREASWADLLAGGVGATIGLTGALAWTGRGRRRAAWCALGAIAFLAIGWAPARHLLDARRQILSFPILATFEDSLEMSRWKGMDVGLSRARRHASEGAWSMAVAFQAAREPVVDLAWVPPDWRGRTVLCFDAYVDGPAAFEVDVEAVDLPRKGREGARARIPLRLRTGANPVRVSLQALATSAPGAPLDLSRMAALGLAAPGLPTTRVLWIDHVRLE